MKNLCFACGGELEPIWKDQEEPEGTWFFAQGNYGSGVFDPASGRIRLRIVVCDACLTTRKDRVLLVHVYQPPTEARYAPWTPGETED